MNVVDLSLCMLFISLGCDAPNKTSQEREKEEEKGQET